MFKAGDVVVLKSGGEAMTVVSVKGKEATVVWMGEEGDLFRETLPFVALLQAEFEEEEEEEDEDAEDEEDEDAGDDVIPEAEEGDKD
jgi:uncharacterized protein YodC (DUF2158 family)